MKSHQRFSLLKKLLQDYDTKHDQDDISGQRMAHRLDQLSQISLTDQFGSNRPGYSDGELAAKSLVAQWMKDAQLTVKFDGAGNVIGRLASKNNDLPAIMVGSHVDSVPNGGHFDGVLGVVSALEVVESWKNSGFIPNKPLEIIVFADEEGARFNSGLTGSQAMMNDYDIKHKLSLTDHAGQSFVDVLANQGLSIESYQAASRNYEDLEMFVELHIEQGTHLEKLERPVGIVSGIAGPSLLKITFQGKSDHAGSTPMPQRQDALVAASEFIQKVSQLPQQVSETAVATVGKLNVFPNGTNVIPGEVQLYVDIRDIVGKTLDELTNQVIETCQTVAKKHSIHVQYIEKEAIEPVTIAQENQELLAETLRELSIEPTYLPSGALHDAMVLGTKIPIAMIFVRSEAGISHHPDEWTTLADCVMGARVLKAFIEKMQET